MPKAKTFNLTAENDQAITSFLETSKLLNNGILMGQNTVTFLYKDPSEVGMMKEDMISEASAELAKAQKQFVLQEGLVRAYTKVAEYAGSVAERHESEIIGIQKAEDEIIADYENNKTIKEYTELCGKLTDAESAYKKIPKNESEAKDQQLKYFHEIKQQIEAMEPTYKEITDAYNAKKAEVTIARANKGGEMKEQRLIQEENVAFAKKAVIDRDNAWVFINTTKNLIKDIESNNLFPAVTATIEIQ